MRRGPKGNEHWEGICDYWRSYLDAFDEVLRAQTPHARARARLRMVSEFEARAALLDDVRPIGDDANTIS